MGDVERQDSTPGYVKPPAHGRARKVALWTGVSLLGAALFVFTYYYVKFARVIDAKLRNGTFSGTVNLYAAPETIAVGDQITAAQVVARLQQAGYSTSQRDPTGWYNLRGSSLEIFPGQRALGSQEPGVLYFAGGKLASIVSLQDNTGRKEYVLDPLLITNISEKNREKRRPARFSEIPRTLVEAVISIEDKHFFQHAGFDGLRVLKAAYVDLKEGRKQQGASTLSMQLARSLWLDGEKSWRRKAAELLMTLHLEEKLTKQEIFQAYCNHVYLGRRSSFNINGFGEGARAYFGKNLDDVTLPEAATLAGLVQRPSYFNPVRYPERARERRNVVLALMRQNGYLSDPQLAAASRAPVTTSTDLDGGLDSDAAYFIDMANQDLQDRLGDQPDIVAHVYTTLDPRLQRAANEAVRAGMASVDKLLRHGRKAGALPPGQPQVALVALDPRSGEVKALVGGRNYAASQLNHAAAHRQPGSVFKPFVYTAALDTAVEGGSKIFTPASTVLDAPTTFAYDRQVYEPGNFHGQFMGTVTLRSALAHSLNVATVKVAQTVGYQNVVNMARRCGLGDNLRPTPAVALGAYEATPLEIAGAYTVFATGGTYVPPALISMVRSAKGAVLFQHAPERRRALDPRVAYLMVDLMQEVMQSGTAAGVRARGFRAPAAGKTGTSRDGWFAGFTSELLCVVWVGFDDNRELNLEGSRSALPIWTDFMKRALQYREFRDARKFARPEGITSVQICNESGQLVGPYCPSTRYEDFIDGTQPVAECQIHALGGEFADRLADTPPIVPLPVAAPPQ